MSKTDARVAMLFASAVLPLAGCLGSDREPKAELPFYEGPDFTPRWLSLSSDAAADFHRVPDFALRDQTGSAVTRADLQGTIYAANFFFTSCAGICPKMTLQLRRVQDAAALQDNVRIISHSVTPTDDTPEVLGVFARRYGIDSARWSLLTGEREQIYALGRAAYFIEEDEGLDKDDDDFLHTENVVLVDGRGRLRGIYNGLNTTSVDQLIADIKVLVAERDGRAAQGLAQR